MADDGAFLEFVHAGGPALIRRARLLTGDAHLAEDLVQTTLLKVYLAWGRRTTWDNPGAYAQRVLYTSYCAWRGRRWTAETPTADPPEVATPAGLGSDVDADVHAALLQLPRRQRAVIVARFYDDLSVAQVASLLACSEGTVKSQTARALDKLRSTLATERIEDRT